MKRFRSSTLGKCGLSRIHIPRRGIKEVWQSIPLELRRVLQCIPIVEMPPYTTLPPDLSRWEILERFKIVKHARIAKGSIILEICCGPQAFSTMALAFAVGSTGKVTAMDNMANWTRENNPWNTRFLATLKGAKLDRRVDPLITDARKIPFPNDCFGLVTCIHGVRSFEDRNAIVVAMREMLRVTKKRIFVAETSPYAENKAQEAHLAMYNLRRPVFLAQDKKKVGDIHYLKEEELKDLAKKAGASKVKTKLVRVNQPHHLAFFPISVIDKVSDEKVKLKLKKKWFEAVKLLEKYGEEYPPVITMTCWK